MHDMRLNFESVSEINANAYRANQCILEELDTNARQPNDIPVIWACGESR